MAAASLLLSLLPVRRCQVNGFFSNSKYCRSSSLHSVCCHDWKCHLERYSVPLIGKMEAACSWGSSHCFPTKVPLKLRCAGGGTCASSALQSVSKTLDTTSIYINPTTDFEKQLEEFFVEIKSLLEMGDKDGAIDLLLANYEAVKEQTDAGTQGIEQAATLDVIALGYLAVGDLKFVEHLLDMLTEIVGGLNDDERLLDSILIHMGSMYMALGKFDEAMQVYGRGLQILEHLFGKKSPFLIMPLLGMANIFKVIGKIPSAINIYERAVSILEASRGDDSEELVVPLFALGNLFIDEARAADAESAFKRILSIYMKAYGEKDGRVGMAMCSLAHAICAKGDVEEAIHAYERGLQLIEDSKYMSFDDEILQKMRIDLAELLHAAGRECEGRELLEECLLIAERSKGSEHPSLVTHLLNLSTSHSRSKNYVEAERLLRFALQLMSKTVNLEDQSIATPMLHLAVILYNLKRDKEAESMAIQALHIREDAFGEHSLPVGEALDCLISIQTRLGKDDSDLLPQLKRVLDIQEKELGYESEEVMTTLKKIIFFLDKMGKRDEKIHLQRRLSLLKTKYKQKVPI